MPIANCYIKDINISEKRLKKLVEEWSEKINVDINDISLTAINNVIQVGHSYKILINLFLPSLWKKEEIEKIQRSLFELFVKYFSLKKSDIMILTLMVQSGNVLENGEIIEWQNRS